MGQQQPRAVRFPWSLSRYAATICNNLCWMSHETGKRRAHDLVGRSQPGALTHEPVQFGCGMDSFSPFWRRVVGLPG